MCTDIVTFTVLVLHSQSVVTDFGLISQRTAIVFTRTNRIILYYIRCK
jgi:hypothetical protein